MVKRTSSGVLKVLAVALILLLAVGWVVRRVGESRLAAAKVEFEVEVGSLALADYVLARLDDSDNAASWLRAGAEAMEIPADGSEMISDVMGQEIESLLPATVEAARALIESNGDAYELLAKSIDLAGSSFNFEYEEGFAAETPPLLELYQAGRMVGMDLRLALHAGDVDRVQRDLDILDQLSTALRRESFLVSALVHLGVERLYLGAVRDVLKSGGANESILLELQRNLAVRGSADAVRRAIAGETAAVLQAADSGLVDKGTTGLLGRASLWLLEPFQLLGLLDFYGHVASALEVPWIQTLASTRTGQTETDWRTHPFMAPNILDAVDKLKASELGRNLAIAVVDLSLRRVELGEFPDRLEPQVSDPYASGTVLYERVANGEARLEAPEASALWEAEHAEADPRQRPIFLWISKLPAGS